MRVFHILNHMIENKVAVVIRGETPEQAVKTADACVKGGSKTLEVTFTVPDADDVLRTLVQKYPDAVVGAGTVLDSETARLAIIRGASFIVSPSFDKDVAKLCNRYAVPYLPGIMTVREATEALAYGAQVVKLFPGEMYAPSFIKTLRGPLPHLQLMPTGGVDLDNVQEWLQAGAIMIGAGGSITGPAKAGDYEEVTRLAGEFQRLAEEV
ncbi:bifunctional 2-keto-4-hydroxyglutarate aldolase/2-keto-3-deoxy-6-phosphogluconate aldolase [Marinococcus halophilus]|uniref:Bifunctional 2-keto-4-hydroxyglutarate aldolase/2-keto-3-deoxy-6-phosphogluconate aldolase n=1 Tax=Marinococcus halophilus TaxID=1371 RepID=A0A510Y6A6_MARHA|nr:bifunctional 2-keto-4-hydroxyglutarate aldolase/2-keto-3-deoxy-6-phosphogluconate aldolase [Marinococcus halophilus]OZT80198.1 bifunctional 2-keto-4-hydroxyglutarate aldolase/2-keto-3-deoxy-6-phosphogluconate aldolase [Marinococcus halophilus]GEK58251.1 bifunctional 2-keto-4-hydroxyglutarate aldolase/2-keto-3-deoxy-6-phosphogluconate aldolase [Marinococcus halophilus]